MEEGSPLNKGGQQPVGARKGLIKTPPLNLAPQGAHLWAPLLPGRSGAPCCGWTRPTPSAGAHSHVCTCTTATDLSSLTQVPHSHPGSEWPLPWISSREHEHTQGADLSSWTNEVGPAGTAISPTPCLCLPLPIQQLPPSPLLHTCFCPLFSTLAKSPRLLWSLTSCFN